LTDELCVADNDEFALFYGEHLASLTGFLRHRLPADEDLQQEILQEVWVKATKLKSWRMLMTIPAIGQFRWLVKVARNTMLNRLDHDRRMRANETRQYHDRSQASPPVDYDEHAATQLDAHVVMRLLKARLDEEQLLMLWLRHCEGLELSEVAKVLGIPRGTLQSRLHRLMPKVKALAGAL